MAGLQVGYTEGTASITKVYAPEADLEAWNPVTGAWQSVTLLQRYFPVPHRLLPPRAGNNAGEVGAYPEPEAAALVAAGLATLVGTASPQAGTFTP